MSDINLRVQKIIDQVASSKAEFSQKTGISAVVLSHISSGRNKVSLAAVQQILKAYPDISPDYLVMGKGPIFLEKDNEMVLRLEQSLLQLKNTAYQQQKSFISHIDNLLNEITATN
ncbi:helix-turn-helix transcriptional regulator [bacterium]|nr:helix-turn-helix transcriptional regulator [bacterium]